VRLSTGLKRRLRRAAADNDRSMAEELAAILDQHLPAAPHRSAPGQLTIPTQEIP
jgi:plasmid stability protein